MEREQRRRESESWFRGVREGVAIDSSGRARLGVQSAMRDAAVCELGEIQLTSPLSCAACCTWECSSDLKFSMKSTMPSALRMAW